jgi:hypothetical protein
MPQRCIPGHSSVFLVRERASIRRANRVGRTSQEERLATFAECLKSMLLEAPGLAFRL